MSSHVVEAKSHMPVQEPMHYFGPLVDGARCKLACSPKGDEKSATFAYFTSRTQEDPSAVVVLTLPRRHANGAWSLEIDGVQVNDLSLRGQGFGAKVHHAACQWLKSIESTPHPASHIRLLAGSLGDECSGPWLWANLGYQAKNWVQFETKKTGVRKDFVDAWEMFLWNIHKKFSVEQKTEFTKPGFLSLFKTLNLELASSQNPREFFTAIEVACQGPLRIWSDAAIEKGGWVDGAGRKLSIAKAFTSVAAPVFKGKFDIHDSHSVRAFNSYCERKGSPELMM